MDEDKYSAEFLDIVYQDYTNEEITNSEIDFIVSKINKRSRILDIGCGTGRHSIPLAKKGFKVVGLDNTKEMLRVLRNKAHISKINIGVLYQDILKSNFKDEFDAAICFWNAFDQIATDKNKGDIFFRIVYNSLKNKGKLILEISNPKSFDPIVFKHKSIVEKDGLTYKKTFVLKEFDEIKKTTLANELVIVEKDQKVIRKVSSDIILRWWEKEEIEYLANKIGFSKIDTYGDDYSLFKETSEKLIFVITK